MFFYLGDQLAAVRRGPLKAHFLVADTDSRKVVTLARPLLFDVIQDPSERFDLAESNPGILAELTQLRAAHSASIIAVENQLVRRE